VAVDMIHWGTVSPSVSGGNQEPGFSHRPSQTARNKAAEADAINSSCLVTVWQGHVGSSE